MRFQNVFLSSLAILLFGRVAEAGFFEEVSEDTAAIEYVLTDSPSERSLTLEYVLQKAFVGRRQSYRSGKFYSHVLPREEISGYSLLIRAQLNIAVVQLGFQILCCSFSYSPAPLGTRDSVYSCSAIRLAPF